MSELAKLCRKCGIAKPHTEYYQKSDGRTESRCKSCVKQASREYYYANKEDCIARSNEWKAANPERVLEINREKNRRRRASPKGKLENAISCGIRDGLKIGGKAGKRSFDALGYTVEELMHHLEAHFEPGMAWSNYGKLGWEVDHKIPKSAFNYETINDIDFGRCWALENLVPMWGEQNRKKHTRLEKSFQPSLALAIAAPS